MSEVVEILNKMKNVIMERGWTKTSLEDRKGRVCILGARNVVVRGSATVFSENDFGEEVDEGYFSDEVSEALYRNIDSNDYTVGIITTVYTFNDRASSPDDIIDLIDRTIISEKQRGN